VGVFVTNDVRITGFTLPMEIRTVNGGAYIDSGTATTATWGLTSGGRLNNSALGNAPPLGGTAASITTRRYAVPEAAGTNCSGAGDYGYGQAAAQWDGHSPDGMFIALVSQGSEDIGEDQYLYPGTDPAGTANASLLVRFGANANEGCFIIDTCCIKPANHIVYVDENTIEIPVEFTAGQFTIGGGSCAPPANLPPTAICQNVQVAADGSCQGTATAAQVSFACVRR
jgi:hypothetical protein